MDISYFKTPFIPVLLLRSSFRPFPFLSRDVREYKTRVDSYSREMLRKEQQIKELQSRLENGEGSKWKTEGSQTLPMASSSLFHVSPARITVVFSFSHALLPSSFMYDVCTYF